MKLLGQITSIGEARQWMTQTGPVTIYPVTFEAEGNKFIGDLFASASYITNRGICPGAIGYFTLEFKIKDVKNRDGEVMFQRQDVRFKDFQLANANLLSQQMPAHEEATPAADQEPNTPSDAPQEGINPETGLPF